ALAGDLVAYRHALVRVELVAVLDGVDEGFFDGELDGKDVVLAKLGGLESFLNPVLKQARFRQIAGDGDIDRDVFGTHGRLPRGRDRGPTTALPDRPGRRPRSRITRTPGAPIARPV